MIIENNQPLEQSMNDAALTMKKDNVQTEGIRRLTCVVGTFPDGNSPLVLVSVRRRHITTMKMGHKTLSYHLQSL